MQVATIFFFKFLIWFEVLKNQMRVQVFFPFWTVKTQVTLKPHLQETFLFLLTSQFVLN